MLNLQFYNYRFLVFEIPVEMVSEILLYCSVIRSHLKDMCIWYIANSKPTVPEDFSVRWWQAPSHLDKQPVKCLSLQVLCLVLGQEERWVGRRLRARQGSWGEQNMQVSLIFLSVLLPSQSHEADPQKSNKRNIYFHRRVRREVGM